MFDFKTYLVNEHSNKFNEQVNSLGLFKQYTCASGWDVALSEIGLDKKIESLIKTQGTLGKSKNSSIQSSFISQIQNGERVTFNNTYNFGSESKNLLDPLWEIGGATVRGELKNTRINGINQDRYNIQGEIHYNFLDRFTDPYDTFNWTKSEWNPNGTPYNIKHQWKEKVEFSIERKNYSKIEKLLK